MHYQKIWNLSSVQRRGAKIDPKPARQRGPVWSPFQKQLFIDSILRQYDIPKLYLRRVNRPPYQWEVIDGQQRLRAIWEFYRGEYPLSKDADPINNFKIASKYYEELDDDLKDDFDAYELSFIIFDEADDDVIDEIFLRLNSGVPLNSAEKRNAISGSMRDFVHDLVSKSPLFTKSIGFANKRYSYDEVLAQMTLAELNGEPCQVGYKQLKDMYEKNRTFKPDCPKAKRVRYVLNFLAKAFSQNTPELTKVNSLSLYILASELLGKYTISGRYKEFSQWLLDFEARRREDEARDADERDPDLMQYQLYLSQATGSKPGLQHRHRVLMSDILQSIPDLTLLDDQRVFDSYQRLAIFRRYDGKCANPYDNPDCQVKCEWDNFHADHILPWTAGGKTTISNGQLLCPSCNQKKGAKVD